MTDSEANGERPQLLYAERIGSLALDADQQLLRDLQVHRAELEMQNEELRRTQQQLEVSLARYSDLYDAAPIAYFTLNHAGLILEANPAAAALIGVPRSTLARQPLSRYISGADQNLYFQHRRQLFETGARQMFELRMVGSNGCSRWVCFDVTAWVEASGRLGCRAVVSDISARRHAQDTLRASEARHRILFENSHDALMTLAPPDWSFRSGNGAALQLFGVRDEATFVSHPSSKFWPELQPDGCASDEKARRMIDVAMAEGSHYYEWTYRRLSGLEFSATVLLTRLEIEGKPVLQALVRDETEFKRLQGMLRQSDRLASMGMLTASVAHEINNPLTYVLYNIESLVVDLPQSSSAMQRCLQVLREQLGEEAFTAVVANDAERLEPARLTELAERAQQAVEGAQRIKTIAKAIGTFSRLESTRRSRVDLNSAIGTAVTMARTALQARAELVVELGQLPPVWASEGKLSQVFLNLLLNAGRASADDSSAHNEVRIRTWASGDDVFATVTDTGQGVAEENLAHMFEPCSTSKPAEMGSGLSLCICWNIVTDFGGDISVESQPGAGTRFLVRLPAHQNTAPVARVQPVSEWPVFSGRHARILVVGAEPALLILLGQILGAHHEVLTAESGEEARVILGQDRSLDLILCDLMLPEMTGMALHAWLASQYPALAARLVFISAGASTPRALEYVQRVGNRLIEKPFEMATLARLVCEMVGAGPNLDVPPRRPISGVLELRSKAPNLPVTGGVR